jgi:hypothetical protein
MGSFVMIVGVLISLFIAFNGYKLRAPFDLLKLLVGVVTMGLGGQLWKVHLDVIALYSLKTDVWRLQTALKWSL